MQGRRVAVVGGGPAGVVSCRFLEEAGHEPVVFESGCELGGIWAPEPTNKVVYDGLVTNIPKQAMQSFDLDFPAELPSYIRAADLGRYVVQYAEHFDLRRFVRFGLSITHIEPLRSEEEESSGEAAWRVCWTARGEGDAGVTGDSAQFEDEFDAVVIASGHYDLPYVSEVPGQAEWLEAAAAPGVRTVMHAHEYQEPGRFASRVVLVVGGRSSAVDIAREARGTARWVYVLESGCERAHSEGSCTHVPLGARLTAAGHLVLGAEQLPGPPIEDVVLATGYRYHFPFLNAAQLGIDYGPVGRYVDPLYMHIVHARRPSLCFIGIPLAVPCPIPLFEAQARFVASHLRRTDSGVAQREAWVQARRSTVGARPQDMHFLSSGAWEYQRELVRMSGMSEADYEAYSHRLATVEAIYRDRVSKKPAFPWGDDWYRRCEYTVDWEAGSWSVNLGEVDKSTTGSQYSASNL